MTRIVAVLPDPRRPGAVRVEGDGGTRRTIAQEDAAALGLASGAVLEPGMQEALEHAADAEAAFRTALRALERRGFARTDLGRRLVKKGHPKAAVDAALARLSQRGLLDDTAFARNYAETRVARGRGPSRIRRDLMAMGVGDRDIRLALEAMPVSDEALLEQALAVGRRRASQLGDLPRGVRRRRLLAFLSRRGFSGTALAESVRRLMKDGEGGNDGDGGMDGEDG